MEKLAWLNNHYIKQTDNARLETLVRPLLEKDGAQFDGAPALSQTIGLLKERANTIVELAAAVLMFYRQPAPDAALLEQHVTEAIKPVLQDFGARCAAIDVSHWKKDVLSATIKEVLAQHKLKMPQLAMPLRLLIAGQLQTPAIDLVLEIFGRETVLARLNAANIG